MNKHSALEPGESLEAMFPEIAMQWHPTKNKDLLPSQVHHGKKLKVWWTGDCGHDFQSRICDRTRTGSGCNFCSGRYALPGFNCLRSQSDMYLLWDYEANGDVKPDMVTVKSAKYAHWICKLGHQWTRQICEQVDAIQPCPFCSGSRPIPNETCLKGLHPNIATEWHPKKNGDKQPTEFLPTSKKKVWWLGHCGHEWESKIVHRIKATSESGGCPFCCGKKVGYGNDLLTQVPEIVNIWDYEANGDLTPDQVTAQSGKKCFYKCVLGHTWQLGVFSQYRQQDSCPFCRNDRVWFDYNCLVTTHYNISQEWHPTKNKEKAREFMAGSAQRAWWKCSFEHEWVATICSRTRGGGCPVCANQKLIPNFNSMAITDKELAQQWHPTKNNGVTPWDIFAGNNNRFWWQCKKGHEWQTSPNTRKMNKTGCPQCSGRVLIVGETDFASTHKALSLQWHPTKNNGITPQDVKAYSSGRYWWQCEKGHEWETSMLSRSNGNGCPTCNNQTYTSKIELALYNELAKEYTDSQSGTRLSIKWGNAKYSNLDIFIPSIKTIVEYDGSYWHRDKFDHDTMKSQALIDAGYTVIRVRHHPLPFLPMTNPQLIQIAHHDESAEGLAQLVMDEFS